ncbi:MAG: proton-conducting transporter membrane subunit [Myxococcota bacterium]
MSIVLIPALGALIVLFVDALFGGGPRGPRTAESSRASALSGIRLGLIAVLTLLSVLLLLPVRAGDGVPGVFALDAFAVVGITLVVVFSFLVLALSLTHFGMARSRPGEPIGLLLFSLAGLLAAMASQNLLVLMLALELAWLPVVGLVAIDSRRLSSSESSLKLFFAHAFASLVFAHGIAFLFVATGRLDLALLSQAPLARPFLFEVGAGLLFTGLVARCAVAPFHPWAPDLHEGAPAFVAAHVATAAQIACFLVLLRLLHATLPADPALASDFVRRLPDWIGGLACLTLVWGHAMALVQVGLRRLVGWLAVGQVGFLALALVDARGDGGAALVGALIATGLAIVGVSTTLSSLSHHERACEHVGDLAGMSSQSPARATLLAIFLLSLAGFPGTMGFAARRDLLTAVEHAGHRGWLLAGVVATVLALTAVGRPLIAMLRPKADPRAASRALTNEQVVLAICAALLLYFGVAPLFGERMLSGALARWIEAGVASLRG